MMISPDYYYEQFIAGKSADEIRDAIQDLNETIAWLEEEIVHPSSDWVTEPSYELQLEMNRQYLERAEQGLREVEAEA